MEQENLNEVRGSSLTWIEKDQIAGNCLNKFLKDEPSTSPLYGISSKLLRQLIIEGIDAGLNISDVSESDYIFNQMKNILKKREDDMLWYIKEYFTQDELNRHSENILRMVSGIDGDIAEIKMKLLGRNHSH